MEQHFNSLEDIIKYLYQCEKDICRGKKDNIRIKIKSALKQLDRVYNESKEDSKGKKMFVLIQILKYYLITIEEYKLAYELYREALDEQYNSYLKKNDELDEYFLFATEVELMCAIKMGHISKELKAMSLTIDLDSMYVPQEYEFENLKFYFGKEHIESYGYFIKLLIENDKLPEDKIINKLLSYLNICLQNFYDYTELSYHFILEDIKQAIKKNSYSNFCYNIINFCSSLFVFFSKEDLQIQIKVKEDLGEDISELKKEFETHNNIYNYYDKDTLNAFFKTFIDSVNDDIIELYSDNIYKILNVYCEKLQEYTNRDILKELIELKKVVLPNYKKNLIDKYICEYSEWAIDELLKIKKYKEIIELYSNISDDYLGKKHLLNQYYFQIAYSFSEIGDGESSKKIYQYALDIGKSSSAIYNNLGVIYSNEGDMQRALKFFRKAYELDSQDEISKKNKENTENLIKEKKKKEHELKNIYFKKLHRYHKSILFTIYKYSDKVDDERLNEIINQDKYALRKNVRDLLQYDMLQQTSEGIYIINPVVEKWIDEYINPTLERHIVKVDNSKLYRSIFYHESEINLYKVLIELFPQHFIFPNMSLKTIFDIDKLRELIEPNVLSYLFKAHVDFVIINTATYFPILAFEKDSEYNDKEPSKTNNQYKNQIFKTGGIPLIRLNYNSGIDYEVLKQEVKDVTKNLILNIENSDSNSEFDLLKEIDKKKFGITNTTVDLKIIQKEWDNIVGSGIAIKSKIIDVENRNLIIEISNDLKSIIEISKENINKKLMLKCTYIDDVIYKWY